MKSYMALDEVGIINSPEAIVATIIADFRETDPYQSKLYPVASLKGILALNKGKDDLIISETKAALDRVFSAYFTEGFELDVALVDLGDGSSDLRIKASVNGPDGTVDAAWALSITEDSTGIPRDITGQAVTYEVR